MSAPDLHRRIVAFYDETDWMFRTMGLLRGSPAMHAGLWRGVATHRAALHRLDTTLAERVGVRPGQRILDAGCGAGSSALHLAEVYGVQVIGLTLVPRQAARANAAAGNLSNGKAGFLCADYTRAPLPARSCDVVWAIESICHGPDKPAFLAEACRGHNGGHLVVADRFAAADTPTPAERDALRSWLTPWAMPDLVSAQQFASLAHAEGFTAVSVEDATGAAWPSLRYLGLLAAISLPAALGLYAGGLQSAVQIAGIRGCINQYRTLRQGLWRYALLSARKP
ncbi:MAG: methyltransferase domain-containing protein [Oscillochloris sp.]|nr:methyltransferase domain-containing protein [Oscillochloris sp.]